MEALQLRVKITLKESSDDKEKKQGDRTFKEGVLAKELQSDAIFIAFIDW